jgi:hypothetical protein
MMAASSLGQRARRRVLAALVALTLAMAPGLASRPARGQPPRPLLYVYLQSEAKSSVLEKALRQQLPGLEVTVFGRFRDFEDALGRRQPEAVLAIQPLLGALNVTPALQGLRGERDWEPYLLMSEDGALASPADAKVVGVVDLLGRTGTQQLASRMLGNPAIELRRVTKLEDLLPLLQFSAAQAVLVPSAAAKSFSERSRLRLRVHTLAEAKVGLPAVGVLKAEARALVLQQLQALDANAYRMLGIERWRTK